MNNTIRKAIRIAGGAPNLARLVSDEMTLEKPLSSMAIRQWITRGVPAEYCIPLERVSGGQVRRHELRPDLYPPAEYEALLMIHLSSSSDSKSLRISND